MDCDTLSVVGRQVFCLLVTLLRPIIRVAGGGLAVDLQTGRRRLPRQQGEIVLTGGRDVTHLTLTQTLVNDEQTPMHASFAMLLPRGTVASALTIGVGQPPSYAGVGPRWAVREEFEAIRRAGGSSALVSEDAPGIFSYEVAGLGPHEIVSTSLAAELVNDERFELSAGSRLRATFSALPAQVAAAQPRRIEHLGTSRLLDAVIGIVESRRAVGLSGSEDSIEKLTRSDEPQQIPTDVFVTCERADGASAAFHGALADRPVRLVLDLQNHGGEGRATFSTDRCALEISDCLRRYDASRDDGQRRVLAERITELGTSGRYATLWTSLLAIGDLGHDPKGEDAVAAA